MQINVVAEVKSFFDSVYDYTGNVYCAYVDEADRARVAAAIKNINDVQAKLEQLYKAREKYDLVHSIFTNNCYYAFIKPNQYVETNSKRKMFDTFSSAVTAIINYYAGGLAAGNVPDKVLKSINTWKSKANKVQKIKPQLNIELAIDNFFKSVDAYTKKMSALYTDERYLAKINEELACVQRKKEQIQKLRSISNWDANYNYANKIKYDYSDLEYIFRKPNRENDFSARQAFLDVFYQIVDFYTNKSFDKNPEALLMTIKKWNYTISNSVFKDYVYPFLPLTHFVKVKVK